MATPPKIQIKRTATPGLAPSGLLPGELSVEMGNPAKLWVGVPTAVDAAGKKLLVDTSAGGAGNVVGPATSINNNLAAFADTTGKLLKDSGQSYATLNHTPAFHAYRSAQAILVNTWTSAIGMVEELDTNNCFDGTSFRPNAPGWYMIGGQVSLPSFGGQRGVAIWWGMGGVPSQYQSMTSGTGTGTATLTTTIGVSGMMYFNGTTDYVELACITDYPSSPSINYAIFWGYKLFPFNVTP